MKIKQIIISYVDEENTLHKECFSENLIKEVGINEETKVSEIFEANNVYNALMQSKREEALRKREEIRQERVAKMEEEKDSEPKVENITIED